MSEIPVPTNLPTISEKISGWLGFKITLPSIALPQTVKNLDKALARLVTVSGDNLASRIERNTSLREARAKAETRVIDASGEYLGSAIKDGSALAERALEFAFGDSVLKQSNRETIARLAIEDFTAKAATQTIDATAEIDDDWLNSFSDLAARKSDADIQTLWARILSGKIRQPSSFSLKSLELLASLDTRDAHLIHEVLSYSISRSFIYKTPGWEDISRFITGEDLGVLSGTGGTLGLTYSAPSQTPAHVPIVFQMSGVILIVSVPPDRSLQIPCFNLTRFGAELLSLSDNLERDTKYQQEFIDFLKNNGAMVRRGIAGGTLEDV